MKASEPSVLQRQTCSLQPNLTGHLPPRGYHSGYVLQHPETCSILKPLLELGFIGRFQMCWARSVYKLQMGRETLYPHHLLERVYWPSASHWGNFRFSVQGQEWGVVAGDRRWGWKRAASLGAALSLVLSVQPVKLTFAWVVGVSW